MNKDYTVILNISGDGDPDDLKEKLWDALAGLDGFKVERIEVMP
jgi:hypothetical protein